MHTEPKIRIKVQFREPVYLNHCFLKFFQTEWPQRNLHSEGKHFKKMLIFAFEVTETTHTQIF